MEPVQAGYERHLRPEPLIEDEESVAEDRRRTDSTGADDSSDDAEKVRAEPAIGDDRLRSEGSPPAETPVPTDDSAPLDNSGSQENGESSS